MIDNKKYVAMVSSPWGYLILEADEECLISCTWSDMSNKEYREQCRKQSEYEQPECIKAAKLQLEEYFCGKRKTFDLPLRLCGTDFQMSVWRQLRLIPYGSTISYSALASIIGNPKATRAVAQACHCNPFAVIIPCHRVIGSNGSLTGYAAGLKRKQGLLDIERLV